VLAACVTAAAIALAGCPSKPPCAYVDRSADAGAIVSGACVALTCPASAEPSSTGRCACSGDLMPLLGACVDATLGARFCGAGARFDNGACTPIPCAAGETLDTDTGICLPQAEIDRASNLHLDEEQDEHAVCFSPTKSLVVTHGAPWCVPPEIACGRASLRRGSTACGSAARCAAGEVADATTGRCERIVSPSSRGKWVVDVAQWARLVLGPDGGTGAPTLCTPFAGGGAMPTVSARLDLHIDLAFPANDVSLATFGLATRGGEARGLGEADVRTAIEVLVSALRAMGGTASAAAVSLHVACELPPFEGPSGRPTPKDAGTD